MPHSLPLKVIIITHLGDDFLGKCVRSIQNSTMTADIVVLVSNEKVLALPPNVQGHQFRENIGYARAVNFALQQYGSQPLLIINDDIILKDDCLDKLWRAYSPQQVIQPEVRFYDSPENIENAGHRIRLDGANQAHSRGEASTNEENTSRLCFSGAAFLISPEIIEKVGLLDPDLSPFGEDLDYSLRIIRQGFDIEIIPSAKVYHKLGHSFGRFSLEKIIAVEAYRIQARLRSFPLFLAPMAPLSTIYRYWQSRKHPLVPSQKRGVAILGVATGILKGYAGLPRALQKRKTDQWVISDREFFRRWWKQS